LIPIFEHFFDFGQPAEKEAPPGQAALSSSWRIPIAIRYLYSLRALVIRSALNWRC
jgi:hypothetical protein